MVDLDKNDKGIDIHHIFPRKWCEDRGISPRVFNSIINKTAISYRANRKIGGRAPSEYLVQLQTEKAVQLSDKEMNAILRSHYIDPRYLRDDDFDRFFSERRASLLSLVEQAMGKQAISATATSSDADYEDDDSDLESEMTVGVTNGI